MADINERKEKRKIQRLKRRVYTVIGICVLLVIAGGIIKLSTSSSESILVNKQEAKPEAKQEIAKPKPTDIVKGSNTTYEGEKYAVPASDVKLMVENKYQGEGKRVFLTFDDGPSPLTNQNLKTLKEKGVHATFFVLGQMLEKDSAKETLKNTIKDGHAIANHSYTHEFKKLYPKRTTNIDVFMSEFDQTNNMMKSILGEDFDSKVLRMPGGENSRHFYKDPNLPELNKIFADRGIVSIDWNALNGDAEGKKYSEEYMLDYVKRSTGNHNNVIVLMHDTYGKQKTADILPKVIDFFKENGYEFKTIKNG